VAYQEPD